jgi:acyl-CoA hydrolase
VSSIDLHKRKRASPWDAVDFIRDGDRIIVPTGVGEPPALPGALSDRRRERRDITVVPTRSASGLVATIALGIVLPWGDD